MRCPTSWLDEVEIFSRTEGKPVSETVREMTKLGMRVIHYQKMMKDPAKAREFKAKIDKLIEQNQITDWAESLTTQQIEGFIGLLQVENETRHKQRRLT